MGKLQTVQWLLMALSLALPRVIPKTQKKRPLGVPGENLKQKSEPPSQ